MSALALALAFVLWLFPAPPPAKVGILPGEVPQDVSRYPKKPSESPRP